MTIEHNTYLGGQIQSLKFAYMDGRDASVGVIDKTDEVRRYQLGQASRREEIKVLSGIIFGPDGIGHSPMAPTKLIFEKDEEIVFTTDGATYLCVYD